ncbi:MAG: hypothetical protein GY820_02610 [Gammaproteobacteria bacterium]|nr:hypothetical protein [Gammaproteobacteria bacterium]
MSLFCVGREVKRKFPAIRSGEKLMNMETGDDNMEMKNFKELYEEMKKRVKRKYLRRQYCRRLEELGKGRKQAEVSLK